MKKILLVLVLFAIFSMVIVSGCVQQAADSTKNGETGPVSQKSLDDLKSGIEGLEIDDLGGLSDPGT